MSKHTKGPYAIGTRYSNSEWYDAATSEFVHGWQIFEQHTPNGKPTGRKSFVNHLGNLCGIEIAEEMRQRAISAAAPELLEALKDAYPYVSNADLRARIGNLIVKAEGDQQ